MSAEQLPNQPPVNSEAEWLRDAHETDVKAASELAGVAAVEGNLPPGEVLSDRAKYILEQEGGDVHQAAAKAKILLERDDKNAGRMVTKRLDEYITEAKKLEETERSREQDSARTQEELTAGFRLDADETVAFEPPHDARKVTRTFDIGNGVKISGKMVAELTVGSDQVHVRGEVIETSSRILRDSSGKERIEYEYTIILPDAGPNKQPFTAKLTPGQVWGIGRRFEGQQNLPDTVSGDHCAIGQDETGKLVVTNHDPTNSTWLRSYGNYEQPSGQ